MNEDLFNGSADDLQQAAIDVVKDRGIEPADQAILLLLMAINIRLLELEEAIREIAG